MRESKPPYLRWHPTPYESLNRYTMLVLHEQALRENAERSKVVRP